MAQPPQARPVRLLAAGGTISMQGERAVPTLDAAALVRAIPELEGFDRLQAENVLGLPGPQISLDQALAVARRAAEVAGGEEGVVITTGTDTLEELAMLCALIHDGDAPIILTGANRPASAAGADGPANLLDAVAVAAAPGHGLGTVVVFGGEIHAAATVRKVDSTGPAAFGSPVAGPVGRVVGGRVWLHARPLRSPTIVPRTLDDQRVPIITAALGDDGELLRAIGTTTPATGVVVTAFGAGHLPPGILDALNQAVRRIPALVTVRPERGSMLHATYGFTGAERDVRASGAVCTPFLSPAAARIALLCCLGAGLDRAAIAAALARYDA